MTTYTAITQIMGSLEVEFQAWDAKLLADSLVWVAERAKAVREFEMDENNAKMRRADVWGFYAKVHGLAGGKTWYGIVKQGDKQRDAFVTRNCEAIGKARNAKIAKQLVKAGVDSVISSEVTRSSDGFNGIFAVNVRTVDGDAMKYIHINTIYAGGYNIQCAHHRTLVKVK